ncbi:MAG: bifunctional adenosylcobinamide kinase/adenosylcobinamide-phosphate guanylyltransferase [Spirochaetaceae bacterium]|jgi:adenosylcobinamide kinase/adenosylcobinamide-phosphate guanylyltransferase|nr:bifunctional adenosylcobinamide kinase/adenosylcobinamide-phosphate guanylyltransferase [Spirochaetaceae bacterium]
MILLITGGVKSGKSSRALEIVQREWQFPVSFIATAEALDEEMRLRIARHREERARLSPGGEGFITIEEPVELDRAIAAAGPRAVVDCIPMWINNLMYYKREGDFPSILENFIRGMGDCIVVSNETGFGNIPFDEATRRYNLLLAEANRQIAAAADAVELLVAGIPLKVK